MLTRNFHFELPPDRIAQHPSTTRDASRLMVVQRELGLWEHRSVRELPQILKPDDVLVLNDSRVIPARLRGTRTRSGGKFEILLLEELGPLEWWTLLKPGKRSPVGTALRFETPLEAAFTLTAEVIEKNEEGWCRLRFEGVSDLKQALPWFGELPLPPYIIRDPGNRDPEDLDRYQTVYAREDGSVAAPTAGLHFTPELLWEIRDRGVEIQHVTLHVGHGTFAPVKAESLEDHVMHEERFVVPEQTAMSVNRARTEGRRVVAVGTTTLRVLESVGRQHGGKIVPGPGRTRIFIRPPSPFTVVDALMTNFHLPESTLLMLVSAFAAPSEDRRGRDLILGAYAEAIRAGYRFFSYGDAMLIQ